MFNVLVYILGWGAILAILTALLIWISFRIDPDWLDPAWLNLVKRRRAFIESLQSPPSAIHYLRLLTWGVAIAFSASAWIAWLADQNSEWGGFRTEATGIAAAVIFFEEMARLRNAQEFKQAIIRQMRSRSEDFAVDAARIVMDNGWYADGSLKDANMKHVYLDNTTLNFAHLEGADLRYARLEGAELIGAYLENANLMDANLKRADLTGARLHKANLMDTLLEGATLVHADLGGANLQYTHLERANLQQACMKGADLEGTHLEGANLANANLEGAKLFRTHLEKSDLRGANLENTDLKTPSLARMEFIEMMSPSLSENDFPPEEDVQAMSTHLEGSIYDKHTKWPKDTPAEGSLNWDEMTSREQKDWLDGDHQSIMKSQKLRMMASQGEKQNN